MLRHTVTIDNREFLLAQGLDLPALKRRVVASIRAGGGMVDFTVLGNREVSVLIAAGVRVLFQSEQVDEDVRDTGDVTYPFDENEFLYLD